ncbi:MAG: queuosine precursor transporter [Bacteroidota bacterium]|nr:queuosine precursor transporter [Bacteroidota bacterium]
MNFTDTDSHKRNTLFLILGSFFITNALVAEFIGAKIFSLEGTLGINPFDISLLGSEHLSFNLTAGVLLWPLVFVMTDIINEYFGSKAVRFYSYLAIAMILYSFVMVFGAMKLQPAGFWIMKGDLNMDIAYNSVYGQGLWIIAGSMVAFLIGQLLDVSIFHRIKRATGEKYIWLRSTGSTLVSQLVDSFVVLYIAFYIGNDWPLERVLAIATMNYIYKFVIALLMTPVIYLVHGIIDRWLGKELSHKMMQAAHGK